MVEGPGVVQPSQMTSDDKYDIINRTNDRSKYIFNS